MFPMPSILSHTLLYPKAHERTPMHTRNSTVRCHHKMNSLKRGCCCNMAARDVRPVVHSRTWEHLLWSFLLCGLPSFCFAGSVEHRPVITCQLTRLPLSNSYGSLPAPYGMLERKSDDYRGIDTTVVDSMEISDCLAR